MQVEEEHRVSAFDNLAVRSRFSSLRGDFVFLDAPGGTQTPDEVADAVARVYREASGNIGVPYATSQRIGAVVESARTGTARFLGCDPDEIMFGGSMTSLNFTLSRTLARTLKPGDEVLVTRLDHDANVAPWLELAHDSGIVVRQVDVNPDTTLDVSDLERKLGPRTRVVAFPWASNAVGTTVDARAVCDIAHQAGALAWIDAVQYAPHEPIDVRAADADVLLCSAYKFCGPHLGIAYGRREVLESWRPYKARPAPMEPVGHRFETGTLPYELLGGLIAALDLPRQPGPAGGRRRLGTSARRAAAGRAAAGGTALRAADHGGPGPDLPDQLPRRALGARCPRPWPTWASAYGAATATTRPGCRSGSPGARRCASAWPSTTRSMRSTG